MSTRGHVAIVTGVSRGIGRAVALALAGAGHRVVVNFREREREVRDLVDAIVAGGGQARAVRGEVGTPAAACALVGAAPEAFGHVDVLVNRFVVSEEASSLTGQVIYVNGGGPGG
jgi:3-oxoacyl-[acyl-carrier protein] reductase